MVVVRIVNYEREIWENLVSGEQSELLVGVELYDIHSCLFYSVAHFIYRIAGITRRK